MKKPKIDLSKEGLKRFFLHHSEKTILFIALLGFVAFLWLGLGTERFSEVNPQSLAQKAGTAQQYMQTASWENVADLRPARDKADVIITNKKELRLKGYLFGILRGIPVQSRGLRFDPDMEIAKPFDTEVDVLRASFVMNKNSNRRDNDLDELVSFKTGADDVEEEINPHFGETLTDLQQRTTAGIQPGLLGLDRTKHQSVVTNIVAVRALINFEKFWNEFNAKLKNSFGYFPDRDKPIFQFVEIQRKLVKEGSQWEDITIKLLQFQDGKIEKEKLFAGLAPEIVAPANHDSAICMKIPPVAMMDYRRVAGHSTLPLRNFDKMMTNKMDDEKKDGSDKSADENNGSGTRDDFGELFGPGRDDPDKRVDDEMKSDDSPPRFGSDRSVYNGSLDKDGPAHEFKVVRFFDLAVKSNTDYLYRFRVWIDDPNNSPENLETSTGPGRDSGGRDGDLGGPGASGGGGGSGFGGAPGGRGGNGAGGNGGGPPGDDEKPKYTKEPITPSMKDVSVRNRIDDESNHRKNDKQFQSLAKEIKERLNLDLHFSRATDWVEIAVKIPDLRDVDAVIGNADGRQIRVTNGQSVLIGDQKIDLVVSDWSEKFGTMISMFRQAKRGDFLGTELPNTARVLHFVDQSIRKLTEYGFESKSLIIDIMGGDRIPYRDSPVAYQTAAEVLLMDIDGNFSIRNSSEDRVEFLNRRFQEDETSEFNASRNNGRTSEDDGGLFGGG